MSRVCLGIHSAQLQKCIMYTSVCLRNQKDNIRLYMIPCKSFPRCSIVRCFATAGSLDVDGKFQRNQTSNIWAPNDSKRCEVVNSVNMVL